MTKLLRLMVPVFVLALCFPVDAQVLGSLGDVQMDETELYTMTKQMSQFINRFNYEEAFKCHIILKRYSIFQIR